MKSYRDADNNVQFEVPSNGLVNRRDDYVTLHTFANGVSISVTKRKMENPQKTVNGYKLIGKKGATAEKYENKDMVIRRLNEPDGEKVSISLYVGLKKALFSIGIAGRKDSPVIERFLRTLRFGKVQLPPYQSTSISDEIPRDAILLDTLPASPEIEAARRHVNQTKIKERYEEIKDISGDFEQLTRNLVVIEKPSPGYTDQARMNNIQGTIRVNVEFLKNGDIGNIIVDRSADSGLARNVVAAVRKIKFVPAQANGIPISVTRTLHYTFSIY